MEIFLNGLKEAVRLLASGDPEVLDITWRTLKISGLATLLSVMAGVPLGVLLALTRFPGRRFLISLVNFGMGLPPVVVGLAVWLTFTRYGPLGFLNLLYTPAAMVVAQAIIATPIVAGFTVAAVQSLPPKIPLQILALGASRWQLLWLCVREVRLGLLAAVMAGFGGVVSEVGASMMVGGNIAGSTRVLTTATVLAVGQGKYELACALSIILLLLSYAVTAALTLAQQRSSYT
ncbi:ABC transporter permease [Desulfovirgula thermocuniculi]|uniref:ABC transporter permease n=1 Tax=Desulfovirgula thermocuniculi TaxID=348842 RepID=UPI0003F96C72|nr:ABC transporter permease [Desulfovirgula thermocuniculi]